MLSHLQKIGYETDGRYATDLELQAMDEFIQTFPLRVQTYQQLQQIEIRVVQQVYEKLLRVDPSLLRRGNEDLTVKWRRDTLRVLRYSAIAMLLNDPLTLRERLLFWFQTIMKAFGAQRSCNLTYAIMQDVIKQHLTPVQASLFCPILEINRQLLGDA